MLSKSIFRRERLNWIGPGIDSAKLFLTKLYGFVNLFPSYQSVRKLNHSLSLFLYFRLFNTVDTVSTYKCWWLDSNRWSLMLEAAAITTCPKTTLYQSVYCQFYDYFNLGNCTLYLICKSVTVLTKNIWDNIQRNAEMIITNTSWLK